MKAVIELKCTCLGLVIPVFWPVIVRTSRCSSCTTLSAIAMLLLLQNDFFFFPANSSLQKSFTCLSFNGGAVVSLCLNFLRGICARCDPTKVYSCTWTSAALSSKIRMLCPSWFQITNLTPVWGFDKRYGIII